MSLDQRHQGYGEQEEDSISIRELLQTLSRNKRLIGLVTVLVSAITLLWIATRTPIYRAQATLLLEADESTGGVLSQLASLSSDPAADAEIALIQSRSLAAMTSALPEAFDFSGGIYQATAPDFDPVSAEQSPQRPGAEWGVAEMEALGLSTLIEPFDLQPAEGIKRRFSGERAKLHRLRAQLQVADEANPAQERPESLDVSFVAADRVLISAHTRFLMAATLEAGDEGVIELSFQPGEPIQALGYSLRLAPFGEYIGPRYRLRLIDEAHAIMRLMDSTSAAEVGRQTNVVSISIEESSPQLAAEIANSLAKNYIRRSVQIGRLKATRTLGFIQRQLNKQLDNLKAAERSVADLQTLNPETISLPDSAKAIIDVVTALELNHTQLELSQTILSQAIEHLDEGDFQALARLGQETPNLLALGYIQELTTLEAEALRLDRTDVAGYKTLLQAEQLRLGTLIEETSLRISSYDQGLKILQSGDVSAIVHLTSQRQAGGSRSDFEAYLMELATFDAEIAKLSATALPANPALVALKKGRSEFVDSISTQVGGTVAGLRAMLVGYEALHGDYSTSIQQWSESERSTIDQSMLSLRERVRVNLKAQLAGLFDQSKALEVKIEQQNAELGQLPQSQLALAQSTRDRAAFAEIVGFLLKSEQEAQITAAATSAAAVLIDPAVPPTRRSFPSTGVFGLLGIILGLLAGSAVALLRNTMRAALHTESEVERASGLAVLGSIPDYLRGRTKIKDARKSERFLPMRDASDGPQAEAYRAIRAALKQAMRGDDALRTLACTSCMMGEGKTVTNADLAIVFAKAGRKVLLVDCDLRRPQIHKLFGAERSPGFGEVLEQNADWREGVKASDVKGLSVLPAGKITSNAGELLASARANSVLEQLKEEYDLVVFDLPPAVVVADVANFASNLDALLLVYRSGVAPGRLLSRTVNMLQQAEVNLLGVIINAVYVGRGNGDYGYGYREEGKG